MPVRTSIAVGKLLLCGIFPVVVCATALADRQKSGEPPQGLRIFTCAHSFHGFVPLLLAEIAKSAGIENHVQLGKSGIGGSQVIQHWEVPDEQNLAKGFLREGKVDVLTLSPIWLPDPGIEKFGEFAASHNPAIRIFVQEFWLPNDVYDPVYPLKTREILDHNAAKIPELKKQQDLYCREMLQHLEGLNSKFGKQVFFLVPVGHAVIALREKILAKEAPGLDSQAELFRDNWGASERTGQASGGILFLCLYIPTKPGRIASHQNRGDMGSQTHKAFAGTCLGCGHAPPADRVDGEIADAFRTL